MTKAALLQTPASPASWPSGLVRLLIAIAKLPPFCRGKFRFAISRRILRLAGHPLLAKFRGAIFSVHRDDHPTEYAILLYPRYDAKEFEFLLAGMPQGGVAVDLGSNIGLYSIPLAIKAGPAGKVLAIDAAQQFGGKLLSNARLSGVSNIAMEIVAVGNRVGTASVRLVQGNAGTATIGGAGSGPNDLPMRPLLDILQDHGITGIDVMKVDIDGSEEIALLPFLKSAGRSLLPRRLVMEHLFVYDGQNRLASALAEAGFVISGTTRSNTLYERRD